MTVRSRPAAPPCVAHLITTLDVGGAEVMLAKVLECMDLERYPTLVVSLTGRGPLASRIEARGVRVVTLGVGPGISALTGFARLVRLLRAERPRVLQTWLAPSLDSDAARAALESGRCRRRQFGGRP
jgi:hypothetical protein